MAVKKVAGLEVPTAIDSLTRFRNWVATLDEHAPPLHYYKGRVEIDRASQAYWDHGAVVKGIGERLSRIAGQLDLGRYFLPPGWVSMKRVGLSTEPDGFLVKWASFRSGRVRVNPRRDTEMLGAPDMVLEVVSRSSVRKDTVHLVEAYARAGVAEYWIVDAQWEANDLRILTLGTDGRHSERPPTHAGWVSSPCWSRAFRLRRFLDKVGQPDFRLDVRSFGS